MPLVNGAIWIAAPGPTWHRSSTFHRIIITIKIPDRGALSINFADRAQLVVDPHAQFESWHLSGHGIDPILVGSGWETDSRP
jgi:hypothetical protein